MAITRKLKAGIKPFLGMLVKTFWKEIDIKEIMTKNPNIK